MRTRQPGPTCCASAAPVPPVPATSASRKASASCTRPLRTPPEPRSVPFAGPKANHPSSYQQDPLFAAFKHLNARALPLPLLHTPDLVSLKDEPGCKHERRLVLQPGAKRRLSPDLALQLFPLAVNASGADGPAAAVTATAAEQAEAGVWATPSVSPSPPPLRAPASSSSSSRSQLLQRICMALAQQGALHVKEVLEAAEFYERTRRRVRSSSLADLACGHGLAGLLFAALEPGVQCVLLVDRRRPASFQGVMQAVVDQAPWVEGKVTYLEVDLGAVQGLVQQCVTQGSLGPLGPQGGGAREGRVCTQDAQGGAGAEGAGGAASQAAGGSGRREQGRSSTDSAEQSSSSDSCIGSGSDGSINGSGRGSSSSSTPGPVPAASPAAALLLSAACGRPIDLDPSSGGIQGGFPSDGLGNSSSSSSSSSSNDNSGSFRTWPGVPSGAKGCCSCISIHACGSLTDVVLDLAVGLRGAVAVMPCCYTGTAKAAPFGVRRALGTSLSADVDRSYRLGARGYHVDWAAIPQAITPMNRILIGEPGVAGQGSP